MVGILTEWSSVTAATSGHRAVTEPVISGPMSRCRQQSLLFRPAIPELTRITYKARIEDPASQGLNGSLI